MNAQSIRVIDHTVYPTDYRWIKVQSKHNVPRNVSISTQHNHPWGVGADVFPAPCALAAGMYYRGGLEDFLTRWECEVVA